MPSPLPEAGDWLTAAEITAKTGAPMRRLTLWRQQGLIPQPKRQSAGLHKGTISIYPAVTVAMIAKLGEFKAERDDAAEWLWRLWLDGYPVSIADKLAARIGELRDGLTNEGILDAGDIDAVLSERSGSRSRKPVRNVVPKHGTAARIIYDKIRQNAHWHSLLFSAVSIALGLDTGNAWFGYVKRAFHLPEEWKLPDWFRAIANLPALQDALSSASPAEIERSRLDWARISEIVAPLLRADPQSTPALIRYFRLGWHDMTVRAIFVAVLIAMRRAPTLSASIDEILAAMQWLPRSLSTSSRQAARNAS